jgi:hypothetical protein
VTGPLRYAQPGECRGLPCVDAVQPDQTWNRPYGVVLRIGGSNAREYRFPVQVARRILR